MALGGLMHQVRSEPADQAGGRHLRVGSVARLWPAELRRWPPMITIRQGIVLLSWDYPVGAGEWNRTLMTSLEGVPQRCRRVLTCRFGYPWVFAVTPR
jgi:hypothetical protein